MLDASKAVAAHEIPSIDEHMMFDTLTSPCLHEILEHGTCLESKSSQVIVPSSMQDAGGQASCPDKGTLGTCWNAKIELNRSHHC